MRVYLAGHTGFAGQAVLKKLIHEGHEVLTVPHDCLDLRDSKEVLSYIARHHPDCIIDCAAIVGGIKANMEDPYKFLLDNLQIQNSLISAALIDKISKFVFLGSSCIYPKDYKQPLKEEYILQAPPEPTNEGYAIAKIAGLKLCEYANRTQGTTQFISLMPCNLYGPGDTYDLEKSHVLSALIKKVHDAKVSGEPVKVWGTGEQRREFLYIEDLADAVMWSIDNITDLKGFINVGTGVDVSIKELVYKIAELFEYNGTILFDTSKPNGMMKKCLDISKMTALGWTAKTSFEKGLSETVKHYLNKSNAI